MARRFTAIPVKASPSTSMYIVLSNGVMKGEKPGPDSMLVDYVRVWQ